MNNKSTPLSSAIDRNFSTRSEVGNNSKEGPNIVDALYFMGKALNRAATAMENLSKAALNEQPTNKKTRTYN